MRSRVSFVRCVAGVLFLQAVAFSASPAQSGNITVTLLPVRGYGPFTPAVHLSLPGEFGGAWSRANADVRGVPVDLHGFSVRFLHMQMDQYVFQSYRAGLLDPDFALDLIARNGWDTTKLTAKHVDQDVPIVGGYDQDGNTVYVVDTRPDDSFWGKDRIVVPPFNADAMSSGAMDSLNALVEHPVVTYEFFDGKKVRDREVTLRLSPYVKILSPLAQELRGKIVFETGVYEHLRGTFKNGAVRIMVAVSNGFLSGVYGGKEDEFVFFPAEDSATVRHGTTLRYRSGDTIELGDESFRIGAVAVDGGTLTLQKVSGSPTGEGIAAGARARDFEGVTLTNERVGLRKLRGKFVLLYFWLPGSPRCTADIPYLNDVYEAYDGPRFSVIGIPLGEGPPLASFTAEHRMKWTQVPASDTSRVIRDYSVGGYPATYLIDPGGTIVENGRLPGQDVVRRVARALGDSAALTTMIGKGNAAFRYNNADRKKVEVAGDFSGWLPLPMYGTGGEFSRHVALAPGRYLYRFIVDGEWTLDPTNEATETTPGGATNNVLVVR